MSDAGPSAAPETMWDPVKTSEYLDIPKKTLYLLVREGRGPVARRVGRHLRFSPDAVREWAAGQKPSSDGLLLANCSNEELLAEVARRMGGRR